MTLTATNSSSPLALMLLLACGRSTPPAATAATPADDNTVEPAPAIDLEAAAREQQRFWVIHEHGVHAYDFEGKRASPALVDAGDRALRLPDGRLLVLSEDGSTTTLTIIELDGRLGLQTAVPNRVVWGSCKPQHGAKDDAVTTQAPGDLTVDRTGTYACLSLWLGPTIHAERGIGIAIDLESHAIDARVVIHDFLDCVLEPIPACQDPAPTVAWASGSSRASQGGDEMWTTVVDGGGRLVTRDGEDYLPLCQEREPDAGRERAFVHAVSTSGRWVLVGGPVYEGLTVYRNTFLFDRKTETLASFECAGGRCRLEPVSASALFDDDLGEIALDVALDGDVASLPEDRFWIDGLLVIPARGDVVEVGGRLVRMVADDDVGGG